MEGQNNNRIIITLSPSFRTEHNKIKNSSVMDIVKKYCELPILPTNIEININKIGVYNYNPTKRRPMNLIKYSTFTLINPVEFPLGKDKLNDYMPDEYISPVVIIDTNGIKYRTNYVFWFPLVDISDSIMIKQVITGKKVFPKKIFIDETELYNGKYKNKWMATLLNLVGTDRFQWQFNQRRKW